MQDYDIIALSNQRGAVNMLSNESVLKAFINGEYAKNANLTSVGDCLINYRTIIARKENGNISISSRKYSPTTSKIQNKLRNMVVNYNEYDIGW